MSSAAAGAGGRPRRTRGPRLPSRRPRALLPAVVSVIALVVAISIFVEVYTSRLWFGSLGYSGVFSKILLTRIGLFVVFGAFFALLTVGNVYLAYRLRPVMVSETQRNPTMERYQDALYPYRGWAVGVLGAILFLFSGASGAGHWQSYLLWRNGVPFGQRDVYFHRDIGFFVFSYPWYRYLLDFVFTALVIAIIATAVTHYLYGGIRLHAKGERVAAATQVQLSVLVGSFVALKAVAYWLDKFGLAVSGGRLITGITYTDVHAVLPSKNVLMIISIICALLFFSNIFRPGWLLPGIGLGLLILSAILIGGIWPLIVQYFFVRPSEADKEAQYIAKNIAATRAAYGIADVKVRDYPGSSSLSAQQLKVKAAGLPGVRLIDPKLVSKAFENLQQMRGFYTMPDVLDVDRYQVGSDRTPQDVVIAARELDLNGLQPSQQNWNNEHTVYTHGYGLVAAFGDRRAPNGDPVWAEGNLPSTGDLGRFQQQIYFGESEPDYSIVGAPPGTPPVEINIPSVGNKQHDQYSTYRGTGGVPIGSTFRKLIYAAKFWNSSILLSGRVNADSRIIYDRSPRMMVNQVAPWLTLDGDVYPAVVNGRLDWIVDGYTTSVDYPQSQIVDLGQATSDALTSEQAIAGHQADNINYVRNSVKAVVDAYDGSVTLYQWDAKDPILRAWMRAFPGLVKPKSAIPAALAAHLRYPEDLFKVQRQVLSTYHVTDPRTFYSGSENWKVPPDPSAGDGVAQPPFYMTVQLPRQTTHFALSGVFVPLNRQNLASFVSVNSDPTSGHYGQMTVLQLPADNTVPGPAQMANVLSNNATVTRLLLPFSRQDAQVLKGNLLTVPLGGEMLYAQPIYTYRGGAGSYPILQYVAVSVGQQVGIGRSFDQALDRALGLGTPVGTQPGGGSGNGNGGTTPPGSGNGTGQGSQGRQGSQTKAQLEKRYLANAMSAFAAAQSALEQGDLGGYQADNQRGYQWLQKLQALVNPPPKPGGSPKAGG
ncbi:MAG TPA: UPF0182 family protein [Nocardioidaceae bacterium]|nr:UPF0182 family protein [Nocardioidaceae bacterium]